MGNPIVDWYFRVKREGGDLISCLLNEDGTPGSESFSETPCSTGHIKYLPAIVYQLPNPLNYKLLQY